MLQTVVNGNTVGRKTKTNFVPGKSSVRYLAEAEEHVPFRHPWWVVSFSPPTNTQSWRAFDREIVSRTRAKLPIHCGTSVIMSVSWEGPRLAPESSSPRPGPVVGQLHIGYVLAEFGDRDTTCSK